MADSDSPKPFRPDQIDSACFALYDIDAARELRAVPITLEGGRVMIAMADPDDLAATDRLRLSLGGLQPTFVAAPEAVIAATLTHWDRFVARAQEGAVVAEILPSDLGDITDDDLSDTSRMAGLVNQLLERAVSAGASDLHFEPTDKALIIRFRVDGVLREHARYPRGITQGLVNRVKVMAEMDITDRRLPQDGHFARTIGGHPLDCRVVSIPTAWELEGLVIRVFDQARAHVSLDGAGFHTQLTDRLAQVLASPHGAILVTGPTGSGKTTTLYAALERVARPERKTLAIEDPVELRFPAITQLQVNEKAGLTFSSALRSFLRADPDVILVGEVRDAETAGLAMQAALTGHLVLTTLHTNDAAGAPARLGDLDVPSYVVGSAVRAVLAQRLLRRLCKECKVAYHPDPATVAGFAWPQTIPVPEVLYRPGDTGCLVCDGVGYSGRLVVGELIVVDPATAAAITAGSSAAQIAALSVEAGTVPIHDDAITWVAEGATSLEELARVGV